jgi:CheY-like chemotaxis protein
MAIAESWKTLDLAGFRKVYTKSILAERVIMKLAIGQRLLGKEKKHGSLPRKKTYDIILMDIQMPEMDGIESTQKIWGSGCDQPILIAKTANAMKGERDECLRAGMNDYISKPLRLETLIEQLEK